MPLTTRSLSVTSILTARLAPNYSSAPSSPNISCHYQVHFNAFSSPKPGQFWGTFTTDTEIPPELGGPTYHEEVPGNRMANSQSANKVSMVGGPNAWNTVLLARLRFKPDVLEPTSL
jgi:hypothetical protein